METLTTDHNKEIIARSEVFLCVVELSNHGTDKFLRYKSIPGKTDAAQ